MMQLHPQEEEFDQAGIIGREFNQVPVENRSIFPYNCICRLLMNNEHQRWQATAFLVSPDQALSAAHNIYLSESQFQQTRLVMYVYEGQQEQRYEIQSTRVNKRYLDRVSPQDNYIYDYCLIKLKRKVTSISRFLQIEPNFGVNMSSTELNLCTIGICGFPLGYKNKMMYCYYQDSVKEITDFGTLKHWLPTSKGHSGCPILIKRGQMVKVIGIHKGGAQGKANFNFGRIFLKLQYDILTEMLWDLFEWSKQLNNESSQYQPRQLLAHHQFLEDLPKRQQLIFCDPQTKDFRCFEFQNSKIALKEGELGWKRLFSKQKINLKSRILIKNITLLANSTICFGFVSQSFKNAESTCNLSGFKKNYICMMATLEGNSLKGEVSICNSFNKDIYINQEDELFMQIHLGKPSENPQISRSYVSIKKKQRQESRNELQNLFEVDLSKNGYNFAVDTSYYFYVSMCSPDTSAEIRM